MFPPAIDVAGAHGIPQICVCELGGGELHGSVFYTPTPSPLSQSVQFQTGLQPYHDNLPKQKAKRSHIKPLMPSLSWFVHK